MWEENYGYYTLNNTTNYIWRNWADNTSTASNIYGGWVTNTSDTTDTGTVIYYRWANDTIEYRAANPYIATRRLTEEERRRHEQREREVAERIEKEKREREEAEKVAEELLLRNLTPEQREMYQKMKKFHVISETGKRFEVDCRGNKRMHNVFELNEEGKRVVEHCIYQSGPTPLRDNWLAQKLLLEADEKAFRRIANQTRLVV